VAHKITHVLFLCQRVFIIWHEVY